jgi:hypothetical protein
MASPIAHIVFGKKIFERIPHINLLWPEFVVGTSFPDIRYPAKINRELTHIPDPTEKEIPLDNSFLAGMYVHSLIDYKFAHAIEDLDLYNWETGDPIYEAALKYAADRILVQNFQDRTETTSYFQSFYPQEYQYVSDKNIVVYWHHWLQEYITKGPIEETALKMVKENNFSHEMIERAYVYITKIENDKEIIEKLAKIEEMI